MLFPDKILSRRASNLSESGDAAGPERDDSGTHLHSSDESPDHVRLLGRSAGALTPP
jgi:hypothetical protein